MRGTEGCMDYHEGSMYSMRGTEGCFDPYYLESTSVERCVERAEVECVI